MTRKPTAFDLGEVRYEPEDLYPDAAAEEAAALAEGAVVPVEPKRRRGRWLSLLLAALAGLIALGLGLAVDNLIRDLFARNDWLGWLALALAAIAA